MRPATEIAEQWFERTMRSYAPQTTGFVRGEQDRFRNPVGHTFHQALGVLVEEVLGSMDLSRIKPALDGIIRVRAVQDFSASEAVGFVFELKEVLILEPSGAEPELHKKVDRLALLAFDAFMKCREQIAEIRAKEALRSRAGLQRRA